MRARHRHFNPRDAGATIALDSRFISGLSDDDPVATWSDRTNLNNDVSQSDSSKRPLYKTNQSGGAPAVKFDGTDDRLINDLTISQPVTWISVFAYGGKSGYEVIFDSLDAVQHICFSELNSGPINFWAGGKMADIAFTTDPKLVSLTFNGSSSLLSNNGTAVTTSNAGSNGLSKLSVGNVRGNPNPINSISTLIGWVGSLIAISGITPSPLRKRLEHAAAYSFKIPCS